MIIEKIALRKKTIKRNIVKNKIKSSVLIELNIINFDVNVVALLFSRSKIEEIYGSAAVDFSSYYPIEQQPWTQYMGTQGNGFYI